MTPTFRLHSIKTAAALIGLSEAALRSHLHRGTGPPARKMSPRRVVIREDELLSWVERMAPVTRVRVRPLVRGRSLLVGGLARPSAR